MSETGVLTNLQEERLDVLTCIQCGTCSGSCPSGRYTSLNTRRIIKKARKGRDVLHDDDLWMCVTCYNCQERCPRGIKIVDVILAIRTIAVHEGIMLPEHRDVSRFVLEYGHAVPINDEIKKMREKLGLESLPETVHKYPDSLEDVKTLLRSCEFDKLVRE
ncbi:MAG: CoB--CoM heterodisulfide reductase subunit C [Methanosarcinaceae archaeon]